MNGESQAIQTLHLPTPEATSALAERLSGYFAPGDCILLEGDLGAGKTHFARAAIQARLAKSGRIEDVPSPTFTLVQVYEDDIAEMWHCDLYRLSGPDELVELGLEDAFETAICLIEWPDRLGEITPTGALTIALRMTEVTGEREVMLSGPKARWGAVFDVLKGVSAHV